MLTMAASSNAGTLRWLSKEFLLETLDWVNVMTYDFAGPWTSYAGHNAPLFASSKQPAGKPRSTELTMKYLVEERGIPANRLAVGIPLYGRGFSVAEPYASTKDARRPGRAAAGGNYSNLEKLLQGRLDPPLGRRDQEPLAHLARQVDGDRLRRRRIGRPQV